MRQGAPGAFLYATRNGCVIPDFLDKDSQKKQSLRQQFASERIPLSLFAPAPSAISWVPLTRNLSPAGPSPAPSKALGTRNSLLRYGIRIRCQKQPPGVRDAFSKALGAKNRLMVYGREIRYRKGPSGVPDASSKAQNSLLGYATRFRRPAEPFHEVLRL